MNAPWFVLPSPIDHLVRTAPYDVPAEQLIAYGRLTPLQKLKWLDDARLFTLMAQVRKPKTGSHANGCPPPPCPDA